MGIKHQLTNSLWEWKTKRGQLLKQGTVTQSHHILIQHTVKLWSEQSHTASLTFGNKRFESIECNEWGH